MYFSVLELCERLEFSFSFEMLVLKIVGCKIDSILIYKSDMVFVISSNSISLITVFSFSSETSKLYKKSLVSLT